MPRPMREVETRTFCIGGPAHFPHVAAQVRLAPGERFALSLSLAPGFYLVRSPQVPRVHELRVVAQGGVRRHDIHLGERTDTATLTAGDQLLTIVTPEALEILVRIERAGDRAHALTRRVHGETPRSASCPIRRRAGRFMEARRPRLVDSSRCADAFRISATPAFPSRTVLREGRSARPRVRRSLVKTFGGSAFGFGGGPAGGAGSRAAPAT